MLIVAPNLRKISASPYVDVDVETAYNMITNGSYPDLLALDVRTQSEYDSGHIYSAVWIPRSELEARIDELAGHEDHEIIVYCFSGGRSATASAILDSYNFTRVYNMLGGISAWQSAGYPVWIATVHNVNTTFNYDTIQAAIDAPQTSSGHTILVNSGTYYEHVVVNKAVSLVGEESVTTIIDGNGTWNPILDVPVMEVEISGFTIQHGGYGIYLKENGFCNVHGNIVRNNTYAIAVLYSDDNTIAENILSNNRDGIALMESDNNIITSNNVSNNYGGISLSSSGGNTLRSNNMTENRINFGVMGPKLSHHIQDIDTSNTVDGKPIYYLINQQDFTIDPYTFPDIGYLGIVNSTNVVVKNLDFDTNNLLGVALAYTTYSTIENVAVSGNEVGIGLVHSHNNIIVDNMLTDNSEGIEFAASDGNIIPNNEVSNNSRYGIFLYGSRNNTVYDNMITNNGDGIYLNGVYDSTISGNTVTNNEDGIVCGSTYDSIISENEIKSNNDDGIYMGTCLRNIIDRNELTNNTIGLVPRK